MKTSKALGKRGEEFAIEYLKKKGYEIIGTNFRYDRAEIDVIARDRDVLVFVEVKTRRANALGEPEDAVTFRKRDQIRKAAQGYLFLQHLDDEECRFDVLGIEYERGTANICHIEDAF
jgi:putative endonuclease